MMRFDVLGFFSLLGSLMALVWQALISLTQKDLVWHPLRPLDVIDPEFYQRISETGVFAVDASLRYVCELPLSLVLMVAALLLFVLGGMFDR